MLIKDPSAPHESTRATAHEQSAAPTSFEAVSDRDLLSILIQASSDCLLYTSPSPRDGLLSRMPSSA